MRADIAVIGAGVMGANLALNIAEKGRSVALFDREPGKAAAVVSQASGRDAEAATRVTTPGPAPADLIAALESPRSILLLVPAGAPVDAAIETLSRQLGPEDALIDCGNANFHDTVRRAEAFAAAGRRFLGVGVSGGAEGARNGPSIMAGGDRAAWDILAPTFEAIAARYEGAPCSAWLGPGGAGHFVKTLHNGVEYADMQMIAEVYGVMRDGLGMSAAEIGDLFAAWNEGPLRSHLVEITAAVARTRDPISGAPMLEVIEDRAGQKGTGRWSAIEALHLGVAAPAIEAAVAARTLSADKDARRAAEGVYGAAPKALGHSLGERAEAVRTLEAALIAGKLLAYAQGVAVIRSASERFGWETPLPTVARIWRAGCIIRAAFLDDIAAALEADPSTSLLRAPAIADRLGAAHGALRQTVAAAVSHGLPVPALSASLAYFDMARTARGTANMLQAQRDFFGAHGFRRVDQDADDATVHHGPW